MSRVRMEHPKLPGQPIYVSAGRVASRRRSGWQEAAEPEPTPVAEQVEPEPKPSRRRRAAVTTEEEHHGADAANRD